MEPVCVVDLASCRFVWAVGRATLAAQLLTGETIGVADTDPARPDKEAALNSLDAALDRGRIIRVGSDGNRVRARVALYNPYTFEIALGALPATRAFGDGRPLELPDGGVLGHLSDVGLVIGARTLSLRAADTRALTEAWRAHNR